MKGLLQGVRPTYKNLSELLAGLGDNPHDIASTLQAARVTGIPRHAKECAIAVYLHAVLMGDSRMRSLEVWNDRISIKLTRWWCRRLNVRLSQPLREFVSEFDRLRYPDLVRTAVVREDLHHYHAADG